MERIGRSRRIVLWVQRHRAMCFVAMFLLAISVMVSAYLLRERDKAYRELEVTRQEEDVTRLQLAMMYTQRGDDARLRERCWGDALLWYRKALECADIEGARLGIAQVPRLSVRDGAPDGIHGRNVVGRGDYAAIDDDHVLIWSYWEGNSDTAPLAAKPLRVNIPAVCLALNPSGARENKYLLASDTHGMVRRVLYDKANTRDMRDTVSINYTLPWCAAPAAMDCNENVAAAVADSMIVVWDVGRGCELARWQAVGTVRDVLVHVQCNGVVTNGSGGSAGNWQNVAAPANVIEYQIITAEDSLIVVRQLNAKTRSVLSGHEGQVRSLACNYWNSRYLASGGNDHTVRIWDLLNGKLVHTLRGHGASVEKVVFVGASYARPGERPVIASASTDQTVKFWDVADNGLVATFRGPAARVASFGYTGRGAVSSDAEGNIRLWRVPQLVNVIASEFRSSNTDYLQLARVKSVVVSEQGAYVTAAGDDEYLRKFTFDGNSEIAGTGGGILPALMPDSCTIKVQQFEHAGQDLPLWGRSGNPVDDISIYNALRAAALSPDRKLLAVGGDHGIISVYVLPRLEPVQCVIRTHHGPILALAFSADGKRIASGGSDMVIRVWDAATGASIGEMHGHSGQINGLAFSVDGRYLASVADDGTARLWDAATLTPNRILRGHAGAVNAVAFSTASNQLLTGGADHTVRLWDINAGYNTFTFGEHSAAVSSVAFFPDGKRIVSGGHDGKVIIYPLALMSRQEALKAITERLSGLNYQIE